MLDYLFLVLQNAAVFSQITRDAGLQYAPMAEFNTYSTIMRDASRARWERLHGRR